MAYRDLVHHLVSEGLLGQTDAQLVEAWVADLEDAKYEWPTLLPPDQANVTFNYRQPAAVDGRQDATPTFEVNVGHAAAVVRQDASHTSHTLAKSAGRGGQGEAGHPTVI
jgi:hypothetical protein